MSTIIQQINESYESFTPSFKKVADYLLANSHEAQYLSISDLADVCGVGKATISRFCAQLGYEGYGSLKLALARLSVVTSYDAIRSHEPEEFSVESLQALGRAVYEVDREAMEETLAKINWAALERAAQILHAARDVYCLGHGGCHVVAEDAWSHFITMSPKFRCVSDAHCQIMSASLMDKDSAVLFITYLGVTRDSIDVLKPAHERGAKVILVTHYPNSPAAEYADEVLVCGGHETPLEGGSISAKISMLFAVSLLAQAYMRLDPDTTQANADLTADALAVRMM